MIETEAFVVTPITRAIRELSGQVRNTDDPNFDPRIKAMVLTQLQLAELLSLILIKEPSS